MKIDWTPLREIIASKNRFVLTTHVRPDADAIGSEIAMAGLLEQLGKEVRIVNASPVPPRLEFIDPEKKCLQLGAQVNEAERSEEHTSELQSPDHLVSLLLLHTKTIYIHTISNLHAH